MWPFDVLGDPAWRSLTWTLLHFLWQGMIVASVWKVLFRLIQARRIQIHYLLGLGGMFALAACPVATLVYLESDAGWQETRLSAIPPPAKAMPDVPRGVPVGAAGVGTTPNSPALGWDAARWRVELAERVGEVQPYLLGGWIIGLVLLSGRLLIGVVGAHRLRRGCRAVSRELANRTAAIAGRMGFGANPRVCISGAACEAVVTGLLRPMVLLPVAWLAEMTPEVLEAVIAHELAHIRRFDLWANLFQRIVETLLFYHPAVWWLSRRVRLAREMCCDELATRATENRVAYATALELAAQKRLAPDRSFLEVALGVTQMTLLHRVRNVLGLVVCHEQGRWWPAAVLTLLVPPAIWLVSLTASTSAEEKAQAKEAESSHVAPAHPVLNEDGKYTASAFLRVSMQEKPILGGGTSDTDRDRFEIYKNTQQQLLVSRFVLRAALRKPDVAKLASVERAQTAGDAVTWLAGRLRVGFPGNAEIMEVSVRSEDRKEAATLVDAVVDAYLTEVVNAERNLKQQRLNELDRAYAATERNIRERRQELKQLAEKLGTSDTETLAVKQKLVLEELTIYRQETAKTRSDLWRLRGELAAQQALLKGVDSLDIEDDVDILVERDPVARQLATELEWRQVDQGRTDGSGDAKAGRAERRQKDLKAVEDQFDARRAKLAETVRKRKQAAVRAEIQRLETSIGVLTEQQKNLENESQQMRKDAEKFGTSSVDIEMMRADIKNLDTVLTSIVTEKEKLTVEMRMASRVTLLQRAEVPEK